MKATGVIGLGKRDLRPSSRYSLTTIQRERLVLLTMCVAQFMVTVDQTIVNVALPFMQRQLAMSPGDLEWVIGAYSLSLAALVPTAGALGDRYGRKRLYLVGVAIFAVGSTACALSSSDTELILSRAIQGVGGSAMMALTLSILTHNFPRERRASTIGIWAAVGGLGFGAGPIAGGILLSFFGWSAVFWVNLPFSVVALVSGIVAVEESSEPASRSLDIPGLACVASGLVAITYAFISASDHPWGSPQVADPLATGVVLLGLFVWWELRAREPMIPSGLLKARSFVGATIMQLCGTIATAGVLFWATLLFQDVRGWSVLRTGLSWVLMNLAFVFTARLTGRFDRGFAPSVVAGVGCVLSGVGILLVSRSSVASPFLLTGIGYVFVGLGSGIYFPVGTYVAMRDIPNEFSGAASGILNAVRQAGASIGLAVLGSIGVQAAASSWSAKTASLSGATRNHARALTQDVGGGRLGSVTSVLGARYRTTAAMSFDHGYQLALGAAAATMFLAAVAAFVGFRRATSSASDESNVVPTALESVITVSNGARLDL